MDDDIRDTLLAATLAIHEAQAHTAEARQHCERLKLLVPSIGAMEQCEGVARAIQRSSGGMRQLAQQLARLNRISQAGQVYRPRKQARRERQTVLA